MPRTRRAPERATEADRLTRLRDHGGFTQRELASAFGVTSGAIAQWESGERTLPGPVIELVKIYEERLGIPTEPPAARDLPVGRLERSLGAGRAALLWTFLHGLSGLETAPVIKHVRASALRQFAQSLGSMKGLAMKFGQVASYMDLVFSDEDRATMRASLGAKPIPPVALNDLFLAELGDVPRRLFRAWSYTPVAVASIGQVHRATTHDGREVAVKVQHPRMDELLDADLRSLELFDRALSLIWARQTRGVFLAEFRARLSEECDYRREAEQQRSFAEAFRESHDLVFAEVVPAVSTGRVLTTTWLTGRSFEAFAKAAPRAERDRSGAVIWKQAYESVFLHHRLHADPQPDNVLFENGKVAMLDFRRVKRFSPGFVQRWRRLFRTLLERDEAGYRVALVAFDCVPNASDFDFEYSYRAMLTILRPCLAEGPFTFDAAFMRDLWRAFGPSNINRARIDYPPEAIFIDQLYFGIPALLARLGARFDARTPVLDLLYPDETRPPPFGAAELARLAIG